MKNCKYCAEPNLGCVARIIRIFKKYQEHLTILAEKCGILSGYTACAYPVWVHSNNSLVVFRVNRSL